MANYYTGTKQMVSIPTIIAALIEKTSAGVYGLRIVSKTYSDTDIHPIGANQEIDALLRQSIAIGTDSKPALRVVITEKATGTGLTSGSTAGSLVSTEALEMLTFVETSDGEIALQIYSIT